MLRSRRCQFVNADAAVCRGDAPFGFDEVFLEESLQSGIEGAFFDLEEVVGDALDVLDKGVAVERLTLQGTENHHLKRAGEEVALFGFFHGFSTLGTSETICSNA